MAKSRQKETETVALGDRRSSRGNSTRPKGQLARHVVREHITLAVADGQLLPGQRITQKEIAEELGVSQGIVREALFELKGQGILDIADNRGAAVSANSRRLVIEAAELREMVEGLVARRCCDRITRLQAAELREIVDRMRDLNLEGKRREAAREDRRLHLALFEIADSELLLRLQRNLGFLSKMTTGVPHDTNVTHDQHAAILDAMLKGDKDMAEGLMREHIRTGRVEMEASWAAEREDIHWMENIPAELKS